MAPVVAGVSLFAHPFERIIGLKRAQQLEVRAAVLVHARDDGVNDA
jgi:hypothetical protein